MNQYNNNFQYYPKENEDWLKENNLFEKALVDIEYIKGIVRNLINSNTSKKEIISDVIELDSADLHYINFIKAELKKSSINIIAPFDKEHQADTSDNSNFRNLIRVSKIIIPEKKNDDDYTL